MAIEIKLPEIGEGVTEGELVKWLVKVGDTLKVDQAFAEVMTDKATVEVPTAIAGVVKALKAKEGDMIKVEQVMIELEVAAASGTSATPAKPAHQTAPQTMPQTTSQAEKSVTAAAVSSTAASAATAPVSAPLGASYYPPAADSKVLATPATRRLAREVGVDINNISGSGLAGRVTREDVLEVKSTGGEAPAASVAKAPGISIARPTYQGPQGAIEERVAIRGVRRKIAENMQLSKHIIPHFTLMDEANVSALVEFREKMKSLAEKEGTKITYLPFVIKALIATIRQQYPMFNASIDDAAQEIVYKKYFNIGFAADTPNGLVVPVIKDADRKSIVELSKEILDLSKRARDGKLKLEEMKGATITITNIGSVGGTYATPIINHPEVAILGMYKIQDKVIVENGDFKVVKAMNYTITADHRLIDGAVAANFLKAFFQRIENPAVLMAEMV